MSRRGKHLRAILFADPAPMLEDIDRVAGGILLHDELRGDFAAAQRMLDVYLGDQQARQLDDDGARTDTSLLTGILCLKRGRLRDATEYFVRVGESPDTDDDRRLLAFAWETITAQQRWSVFPGCASSSTLEIEARWDTMAQSKRWDERWAALIERANEATTALATYLFKVLRFVPVGRYVLASSRFLQDERQRQDRWRQWISTMLHMRRELGSATRAGSLQTTTDRYIAELHQVAGADGDAREQLQRAHGASVDLQDPLGVAQCWLTLGDWWCAPTSSPLVCNCHMLEGDWSSDLSWNRERTEWDGGSFDLEITNKAYEEAESICRDAGATRGQGRLRLRRSYLAMRAGDHVGAEALAEKALQSLETVDDRLGAQLALVHRALARIGQGIPKLDEESLVAIGSWGANEGSFSFATGLGVLFTRTGRYWLGRRGDHERAMRCYDSARLLFEHLGARDGAALALADRGMTDVLAGEHSAALFAFERVREEHASRSMEDPRLARATWEKAVLVADEVCQLHQTRSDGDGLERAVERMLALHGSPARGGPSLFGDQPSDTLERHVRARAGAASVLAPLYRSLDARQSGDESLETRQLEEALRAAEHLDPPERWLYEATALRTARRDEAAADAFTRYIDAGGVTRGFIGDLAAGMAERFGPAGAAIASTGTDKTHGLAARFYAHVQAWPKARGHLEAIEASRGPEWWSDGKRPWETLCLYGEVAEGHAEYEDALSTYDRGIAALEERRMLHTRDELKRALASDGGAQWIYICAARTAMRAFRDARAAGDRGRSAHHGAQLFAYGEQAKARALLDLMAGGAVDDASSPEVLALRRLSAERSVWLNLHAREYAQASPDATRLEQLSEAIERSEAKLKEQTATLGRRTTAFTVARIMTIDELGERLPPDGVLLNTMFLGQTFLTWAVDQHGVTAVHEQRIDVRTLNRMIHEFHRHCAGRGYGNTTELGRELSRVFLEPLEDALLGKSRLFISPYGASHRLPFHVLPWHGGWLGETLAVSYWPNASSAAYLDVDQPLRTTRLLVVGNPEDMHVTPPTGGPPRALPPLPASEVEARYVATLFDDATTLVGPNATEAATVEQMPRASLIHFATHGVLFEDAPLCSSILLAHGGALRVDELMGMQLDADLVVLSACQTGRGQTTGGDDVIGLARGLLSAGARALLVSLWPVGDLSAAVLMGRFYRELRAGEPPALALQRAQIYLRSLTTESVAAELDSLRDILAQRGHDVGALEAALDSRELVTSGDGRGPLEDYDHPSHWAPFVLLG